MTVTASKGNSVTLNTRMLTELRETLPGIKSAHVDVGLFSNKAARKVTDRASGLDNPNIGLQHEFGNPSTKLPERSFLRFPLMVHLWTSVKQINWIEKIQKIGLLRTLKFLGVVAEETIQESFATRGWGQWRALQPATIEAKGGSDAVLIETNQLRRAISSRVVKS